VKTHRCCSPVCKPNCVPFHGMKLIVGLRAGPAHDHSGILCGGMVDHRTNRAADVIKESAATWGPANLLGPTLATHITFHPNRRVMFQAWLYLVFPVRASAS